jgi:uncharacterized delta-60 repeat protein
MRIERLLELIAMQADVFNLPYAKRLVFLRVFQTIAAIAMALLLCVSNVRAQIPGSVDTSFGVGGAAKLSFYGPNGLSELSSYPARIALQSDQKILAVGICSTTNNRPANKLCVSRLNPDGSFDTSFIGPNGTAVGLFSFDFEPPDYVFVSEFALAVQVDGKILIATRCDVIASQNPQDFSVCIVRLNSNGSFDTSFVGPSGNANGRFRVPSPFWSSNGVDLAVQNDGKIVFVYGCQMVQPTPGIPEPYCVARRLNADGSFDMSFGTNGEARLPSGQMLQEGLPNILIQPDGKILLIGKNRVRFVQSETPFRRHTAIRYNSNGSLDTTYNPNGLIPGVAFAPSMVAGSYLPGVEAQLQPDDKLVMAGLCTQTLGNNFLEMCVARINADGTPDESLTGPDGAGRGEFRFFVPHPRLRLSHLKSMALQSDGKIVLAGGCLITPVNVGSLFSFMCAARFEDDGRLDLTFDGDAGNGDGRFLSTLDSTGKGIVMQPDGKALVYGSGIDLSVPGQADTEVGQIIRLHGGTFAARQCSLDLDGDNVLTTIDTLISTRIALGFRSASVLDGIVFPANATRNNWQKIREFLVNHCQMSVH